MADDDLVLPRTRPRPARATLAPEQQPGERRHEEQRTGDEDDRSRRQSRLDEVIADAINSTHIAR